MRSAQGCCTRGLGLQPPAAILLVGLMPIQRLRDWIKQLAGFYGGLRAIGGGGPNAVWLWQDRGARKLVDRFMRTHGPLASASSAAAGC